MKHQPRHPGRPAPEVTRAAFPWLATFLRGYLHEDWALDYEDEIEARSTFLEDMSPGERRAFAEECAAFHARTAHLTLEELREVLAGSLGGSWSPRDAQAVREVLRVP